MNPHFVSVVVPCHNAAPFIGETIRSILDQTRAVDEVIVVDDGSTDASADIAQSFGAPVRVVRQTNSGECAARNRGVMEAKGDIIAFLDADDLWHPEKIARQLACFDAHPEAGAVMTSVARFSDDVRQTRPFVSVSDEEFRKARPRDVLARFLVNQSAIAVRSAIARSTPYPNGLHDSGDMIQGVELRMKTEIRAVPEVLAFYRRHEQQVTKRAGHAARSFEVRLAWARDNFQRMGASSLPEAIAPLLDSAVERTMLFYWARDIEGFKNVRDELLAMWPPEVPVPKEMTRFLLPRTVLIFRDWVGRVKRLMLPAR